MLVKVRILDLNVPQPIESPRFLDAAINPEDIQTVVKDDSFPTCSLVRVGIRGRPVAACEGTVEEFIAYANRKP
jgi:hypothetical protein